MPRRRGSVWIRVGNFFRVTPFHQQVAVFSIAQRQNGQALYLPKAMLQEFIVLNREEIIRRCKGTVPMFLDQLGDALGPGPMSSIEISYSAIQHGHNQLLQGFTVSQVVHSYGDVCQSITELAVETSAPMTVEEFGTLNRCLDDAIAGAVTEYGRVRTQSALAGENARELAAVVTNLLQNAFKFTKPGTIVTLRVGASEERVAIEVEDECGGLPGGNADDLFHPFEQRGANRTGVGLGLAFCRWAVEANDGRIYARTLPGTGCIFTIDLPRYQVLAAAAV